MTKEMIIAYLNKNKGFWFDKWMISEILHIRIETCRCYLTSLKKENEVKFKYLQKKNSNGSKSIFIAYYL